MNIQSKQMLFLTIAASASYPLVIHAFVPLRTHESPSNLAVVDAAPASLPLPINMYISSHREYYTTYMLLWTKGYVIKDIYKVLNVNQCTQKE